MQITPMGAASEVTGSAYFVEAGDAGVRYGIEAIPPTANDVLEL